LRKKAFGRTGLAVHNFIKLRDKIAAKHARVQDALVYASLFVLAAISVASILWFLAR
jgi:hypothetical protein